MQHMALQFWLTRLLVLYGGVTATTAITTAEQKPIAAKGGGKSNPLATDDFRKHVEELIHEWHVPGFAIGIVDGDDIWTQGYGNATIDPPTPVTPKTLFYGASTSKAFTATSLALMIASQNYTLLDWSTPISTLLPADFVLSDPWATTHITLEDALSHRTGMPRHDKASVHILNDNSNSKTTATVADIVRLLRHLPLNAAPRTTWQYCNHMYVVATHVVQTLTGRGLGDVLREWLWQPLGMERTFFNVDEALAAGEFARGYFWDGHEQEFSEAQYMAMDEIGGAGAVVSCVEDYVRWAAMWVRGGLGADGAVVVPEQAVEWLKTPRMVVQYPLTYALGWQMTSYKGLTYWTHSGGMHAYGADVFFFPSLDFGFVSFGNSEIGANAVGEMLAMEMVEDKLGVPKNERKDWVASFRHLDQKMDAKIAQAVELYYPSAPATPLPAALPFAAYEGTYFHPGYLNFTLLPYKGHEKDQVRPNATFIALRSNATWPMIAEFEHVSGEYWMMYSHFQGAPLTGLVREFAPVEFRVGSDGRVSAMAITWLSVSFSSAPDTTEGKVWFDKVE